MPQSTYYGVKRQIPYEKRNKDIISLVIKEFYANNKNYGLNRLKISIFKKYKIVINKKKLSRIMKLKNLHVKIRKGKYNSYKGKIGKIAPNILKRNFYTELPLRKITTDVTEFKFPWGKVYLQCYLDLFNSEILVYEISNSIEFNATKNLINKLIRKYKGKLKGTIIHSDQGWQYQTFKYINAVKRVGAFRSMSEKGNCLDNAAIENFFGRLKVEMYYGNEFKFKNYNSFKKALSRYINFYNNKRIKTNLKMSPVEFRKATKHCLQ